MQKYRKTMERVQAAGASRRGMALVAGVLCGLVTCSAVHAEEAKSGWVEQMPVRLPSVVSGAATAATDRDLFRLQPGFQIERLFEVPKETHGSWVSLAFDNAGRLLASDQDRLGLSRVTPPPIGSDEPTRVEKLDLPITAAQGMLYAFDSLYVSVNGGPGSGLYRVRDTDDDGNLDTVTQLTRFRGGGEHGPHAVRLGPDGKSLYVVCGNHTDPPEPFTAAACCPTGARTCCCRGSGMLVVTLADAWHRAAGSSRPTPRARRGK